MTLSRPRPGLAVFALLLVSALACAWLLGRDAEGAPGVARHWLGFLHPPHSPVPETTVESRAADEAGSAGPR